MRNSITKSIIANSYFITIMKVKNSLLLFCFVCLILSFSSLSVSARFTASTPKNEEDALNLAAFEEFKEKFHKVYDSSAEEERRYTNFVSNFRFLQLLKHQNEQDSRVSHSSLENNEQNEVQEGFGVTPFFDLSHEEFDTQFLQSGRQYLSQRTMESEEEGALNRLSNESSFSSPKFSFLASSIASTDPPPKSWDWRDHGLVTPVKNQGSCGSCWAFSAIGNIEGQWAQNHHLLANFSEQHLLSCDAVDNGCNGGLMDSAFRWLIANNSGVVYKEESYPYASRNGTIPVCGANVSPIPGATIHGLTFIAPDEDVIESWLVTLGPLSIAVDATTWMFYARGILPICFNLNLNHGVLLVGYNNEAPTPYWIIKNSWGSEWGEQGYIRIKKGTNDCMMKEYVLTALVGNNPTPSPLTSTSSSPTHSPRPNPANSMYVEKQCLSSECTSLCMETVSYPAGQCTLISSGSVYVTCGQTDAVQKFYKSGDCSGEFQSATIPLNLCIPGWLAYKTSLCI